MSEPVPGAAADGDLADLFDNAPFGYLCTRRDGTIVKVNATISDWLGFSADALIGKRFRDILTTPGRILYETNIAPHLRIEGRLEEVALDLVTAAGEKLPVLVNAAVSRDRDGVVGSVRIAMVRARGRRSYERGLREQEAEATRRLASEQETAVLREQFIAVLGHDLRNPLASIVGAASLLRREVASAKGVKIIELMEASVDRMAGLIDDVLDFARGQLGSGISLNRTDASLEPVLRQVVAEFEASHPSREIVCEFDLPRPVSFDPGRMGQLISNLVGNALTHGDPRRPVRLQASQTDNTIEVWVANSGEPIAPDVMDRLFQPFFRGEVRSSGNGLGLGLHIAAEIARAHGGTLAATSDPTETRFTLVFPVE